MEATKVIPPVIPIETTKLFTIQIAIELFISLIIFSFGKIPSVRQERYTALSTRAIQY